MKRNEAIAKIKHFLLNEFDFSGEVTFRETMDLAPKILDLIENKIGMLPPRITKEFKCIYDSIEVKAIFDSICEWGPEQ